MSAMDDRLEKRVFGEVDIIVFSCFLGLCALLGIGTGCMDMRSKSGKGISSEEVAMGGRSIWKLWPATQSFLHSAVALPFMMGIPGEVYTFGVTFVLIVLGYVVGAPFYTHLIMTRLHNLKISNMYEVSECTTYFISSVSQLFFYNIFF